MVDNQNDSKFIKIPERFKHLGKFDGGCDCFLHMFSGSFTAGSRNIYGTFWGQVRDLKNFSISVGSIPENKYKHGQWLYQKQITLNPMPNLHISPHICLSNEAQDHQNFWLSQWGEFFYIKHMCTSLRHSTISLIPLNSTARTWNF